MINKFCYPDVQHQRQESDEKAGCSCHHAVSDHESLVSKVCVIPNLEDNVMHTAHTCTCQKRSDDVPVLVRYYVKFMILVIITKLNHLPE